MITALTPACGLSYYNSYSKDNRPKNLPIGLCYKCRKGHITRECARLVVLIADDKGKREEVEEGEEIKEVRKTVELDGDVDGEYLFSGL